MGTAAFSQQRKRRLPGLWSWIHGKLLGRGGHRKLAPSPIKPVLRSTPEARDYASHSIANEVEETAPVEPTGAMVRPCPPASAKAYVPLGPVRDGLSIVPPLPHVVRELMRELSDSSSSAKSVAAIATSDPSLAATLLRTVNSAALGLRQHVTSVTQAVSYLGYSVVRSLVVGMRLDKVLPTKPGQPAYDQEDLWVHSLAVAYTAEALAERIPGVDKGFVSTLGLLHDIGKLAINSQFPDSAAQVRQRSSSSAHVGESFLDRERRVLGADHAEIGAILATHWKLPADLVEAIRWHHAPMSMPDTLPPSVRTAAIIVHLANQLTKYCYAYSEDMEIDIVPNEMLKAVGLPGPVTRLLTIRLRRAISKAIFFADQSARHPLAAIRRFVRLSTGADVAGAVAKDDSRIGWLADEWECSLPSEPVTIDCDSVRGVRPGSALRGSGRAGRFQNVRFTGHASTGGIERLLSAVIAHQDALNLSEEAQLPTRFLLRRLLPILAHVGPGEPLEVIQCVQSKILITVLRSPAMRFAHRLGADVPARTARATLDHDLANVLNLRWFSRISTSKDGSTLLFNGHVPDAISTPQRSVAA